jgi:hypothetical protein
MVNGAIHVTGLQNIYQPNEVMHRGFSDKLGIPWLYYNRMQAEIPELLDLNVTGWLQKQAGKNVLLRTFESPANNIARAFLSDRYSVIDNYDVLFTVLEALQASGLKVEIINADVTEKKLYLNVVAPEVEVEARGILSNYRGTKVGAGDGIISGFSISNSEVGWGQFSIAPRALILKCTNGMMNTEDAFNRSHLGVKLDQGLITWSQDTKNKNLELVMAQTKDAIKTFLSPEYLGKMIKKLETAAAEKLENPAETVQNVCKELRYTEDQRRSILSHFIQGGDTHAIGITHAITRQAQDENPDTRQDMEAAAFSILLKIKGFDKPFTGN